MAFASLLWGCVSLLSSVGLGASCIRVFWAPDGAVRSAHQMVFGYAVEPNAALWYVLGVSAALLIGCGFLEAAHRGLVRTRTFMTATETGGPDPLARVAATNRRVFRAVTPTIAVLALLFVAVPELARRHDHAFGWVQADQAGTYVGARYDDLKRDGKIGEVPALATCVGCVVRVAAVFNRTESFQPPTTPRFRVFLLLALGHQVIFTAFASWIAAKVLFFFWMLSTALVGRASHGMRLVPDFADTDDFRFGLGRLDNIYYALLWAIALGGVGLSLQAAANVTKGTYFLGDPSPALFGQAVTLLVLLTVFAVVLLTPVCVFLFLNVRAVDGELARLSAARQALEARLRDAGQPGDRERLRSELNDVITRRAGVKKQTLLPIRRPSFLASLVVCLLLLLALPLSIQSLARAGEPGVHRIGDLVCRISGNSARWPR
jgi:hypothetical protein